MTHESLVFEAMHFAHCAHREQTRKYLGNPYTDHLAEVVAISATVLPLQYLHSGMAVGWLHDVREDQDVSHEVLVEKFGTTVAEGVRSLSDLERGNRAHRKRLARERLAQAPGWVQTIKLADCLSNAPSILQHDPKFAVVYTNEVLALAEVLTKANPLLHRRLHDVLRSPRS